MPHGMLSCQLCVICHAAPIVVFSAYLVVRLGVYPATVSISAVYYPVYDILQLIAAVTVGRQHREVHHASESLVIIILVVGRLSEIVAPVVCGIIYAEEVVCHILICPCLFCVVKSTHHSGLPASHIPPEAPVASSPYVSVWFPRLHPPVIVQAVVCQRDMTVRDISARELGIPEVIETCRIIPVHAGRDRQLACGRNVLGVYLYESACEIGRELSTWRFHYDEIVYLAAGDYIERESP